MIFCRHPSPNVSLRTALATGALGLLVSGVLGCEALLSPSQYGEVRVALIVDDGTPIGRAPVTLYTGQRPMEYAATDETGTYTFERVPPGLYGVLAGLPDTLHAMAEAPYLVEDDLLIEAGATRSVTLTLVSCRGSLIVTVRDESGRPASGVPVTAYRSFGSPRTEATGTDGTRTFMALPCGEYGVKVEPTAQYTPVPGRGSSFVDGLHVTREPPTASAVLRVRLAGAATSAHAAMAPDSRITTP
jgi:hypothetical protein